MKVQVVDGTMRARWILTEDDAELVGSIEVDADTLARWQKIERVWARYQDELTAAAGRARGV